MREQLTRLLLNKEVVGEERLHEEDGKIYIKHRSINGQWFFVLEDKPNPKGSKYQTIDAYIPHDNRQNCTPFYDLDGTKIYEGDMLITDEGIRGVVVWSNRSGAWEFDRGVSFAARFSLLYLVVERGARVVKDK